MFCESKSTVLEDLRKKGIIGQYNEILDKAEFDKFNKEFTRFIELTYPNIKLGAGDYFFNTPYEIETSYPYSSRYWRDDVASKLYIQPNDALFEVLDDERMRADIKEELQDYDILNEPDSVFPEDESLDPMFMRAPQVDYSLKVVEALMNLSAPKEDKRTRKYGEKNEPERVTIRLNTKERPNLEDNIRKLLNNKGVKNQQIDFIFDYMKFNNITEIKTDELAAVLASNYSYPIEINTAMASVFNLYEDVEEEDEDAYEMSLMDTINDLGTPYHIREDAQIELDNFNRNREIKRSGPSPSKIYAKLTVPGGVNYTENEIATPDITPAIKGHAQFATTEGIGWFRSDDKQTVIGEENTGEKTFDGYDNNGKEIWINDTQSIFDNTKTRRILEVQSDLFQKGRDKKDLAAITKSEELPNYFESIDDTVTIITSKEKGKWYDEVIEYKNSEFEQIIIPKKEITSEKALKNYYNITVEKGLNKKESRENQFLQLLNKDNNWVTFFIKSIIQDSAKKGYEKVLFPSGNTASKVEGHTTLEEFKKQKEDRIKELEKKQLFILADDGYIYEKFKNKEELEDFFKWEPDIKEIIDKGIYKIFEGGLSETLDGKDEYVQLKKELQDIEGPQGIGAFKPIYNFYENIVANILKKQGYNPKQITDEYGNVWNEVTLTEKDYTPIVFMRQSGYVSPINQDSATKPMMDYSSRIEKNIDEATIRNARAKEAAIGLAKKMSEKLNVGFINITADEATKILSIRKKQYRGEPAFYFGKTVYVVGDNVNFDTVLHEFAHPFLRALYNENKDLFENLYSLLMTTEEGKIIKNHLINEYPELSEGDYLFKEEALVYALQAKAVTKVTDDFETSDFKSFMNKLLLALKDILKKIFGGKKLNKLDVDTTIDELADMFLDETFEFENGKITNDDLLGFLRDYKQMAVQLTKDVQGDKIQESLNNVFAASRLINEKARNFRTRSPMYQKMLKEALFQKGSNELLPRVLRSLSDYQTVTNTKNMSVDEVLDNVIDAEERRITDLTNKSRSFINTLSVINNISKNMYKDLDALQKTNSYDSRDAIALLFLYRNSIRSWNDTFESFDELLRSEEDFDIDKENDLVTFVNDVKNNLLRADKKIRDIYKENAVNFYVEVTGYMNDFLAEELGKNLKNALTNKLSDTEVKDLYDKAISQKMLDPKVANEVYNNLQKKGIEAKYVKKFIDEYNNFLLNQDVITDGLSGKLKDVSWFNRFFESYTSSNDPIVGGLAIFINNQRTEANNRALEKSYMFRRKLVPLLESVGYSTLDPRKLLKMMTFEDSVLYIDPKTKEAKERKVNSFLDKFGNGWRYEQSLLEYNLEKAWSSENKDDIRKAVDEYRQFQKDYMHNDYVPEVYEKDNVFDKYGEVGKMAWLARKMALDAYNNEVNELTDELERYQKYSTLQALWEDYKNLYSLKYADGSSKVDDPENGIYDLSITNILLEYRDSTKDFYEFLPRIGSLQTSFNEFLSSQDANNVTGDELEQAKKDWVKQNIKTAYDEKFYESRTNLIKQLKELQGKITNVIGEEFDMANAYNDIFNLMYAYKDEQGQPIPENLGEDKIKTIKELNQKIIDYKAKFDTRTGLSTEETEELNIYMAAIKKDPTRLTKDQKSRYVDLLEKQAKSGLSIGEISSIQAIYAELSSLTQKIPTEYYVDSLNEHLQRLDVAPVTADTVTDFINSSEMKNLLAEDAKISEWFKNNHVYRKVKNRKTRKMEIKWERSMVNSISVPKNPEYYKTVELYNEMTGKTETFNGVPNARHSIYRIKDKYRTGYNPSTEEVVLEVGTHIDNKGQFLPRMYEPGTKNSAKSGKFMNQDYLRLMNQPNDPRFKLLEFLKEAHLSFQEDKSNNSKLYLDVPRYVLRDTLSRIRGGNSKERASQIGAGFVQYLKDTFAESVDEVENEHNYQRDNNLEEYRLVNTDLNAEEISYIPVTGTYNMEINNTDPDIIRGMFKYLLSLENQSQLLQSLPLVNSILETLEDPKNAPKNPNTYSKNIKKINGKLVQSVLKGAANNRAGQIRSLIDREYHGVQYSGQGSSVYLDKFVGLIQKISSRASLAINIPSDLKNRYGQIVQNMIEAAGGENVSVKDLAKARIWAAQSMLEWSANSIYTKGVPALSSQLIEMFDSAFKFKDDFGRSVSRNFVKDMMNGEWMMSVRKNLEMEATLQLFGGFLNGQKVEQKLSNGKTITINYKDAWQLNKDTGIAELLPGVDPAWSNKTIYHTYIQGETLEDIAKTYGVTVEELKTRNKVVNAIEFEAGQEIIIAKSEKFKQFRNKFQGVSHRLYGAYDDFAQAEGNLYLPFRMFTFMRKWFIPMLTNRWGARVEIENGKFWKPKFQKRYDWMTGKPTIGFYLNAYLGMKELVTSKGKYWAYMDEQQKADMIRALSESLAIITFALLASMVFGYDPDDKDRFEKMRERSGALGTDDFKTFGFIQNHTLLLLLGTQMETSAFVPLPSLAGVNLGGDDYIKMASTTTSAFGNTISLYAKIYQDLGRLLVGSEKAFYSRKEGEYWWEQKGRPKVIGHLLKTVGVTGSSGQVDKAIEGLENAGKIK